MLAFDGQLPRFDGFDGRLARCLPSPADEICGENRSQLDVLGPDGAAPAVHRGEIVTRRRFKRRAIHDFENGAGVPVRREQFIKISE